MSEQSLRQFKNRAIYGRLINQPAAMNNYTLHIDGVCYGIDWNTGACYFVTTCRDYKCSSKGGYIYSQAFENINA